MDFDESKLPARALACAPCKGLTAHRLVPVKDGCAWTCATCGAEATRYSHADMRAMIEAYAGPLAKAANLPERPDLTDDDLLTYEVDVAPKIEGDTITYTGVALARHLNVTHALPVVGETFWGHHPQLAPHVAKFELGEVLAVRRVPTAEGLPS